MPNISLWLKRYLQNYENAFVLISHDIPFLNDVINIVYHVENQDLVRYSGDYDNFQSVYAMKKAQLEANFMSVSKRNCVGFAGFCQPKQHVCSNSKHGHVPTEKIG